LRFMDQRGYNSLRDFQGICRTKFVDDQPELLRFEDAEIATARSKARTSDAAEWVPAE
jgi:hypothetical protein